MKMHHIEIRQREGSKGPMTGANTIVMIDGIPVKGCTKASFEVTAKGVANVQLEFVATVNIIGEMAPAHVVDGKLLPTTPPPRRYKKKKK